ncbi:MAG: energy transducer TonB [Chitinophagaceae bacterium]
MKNNLLVKKPNFIKLVILPISILLFCSFNERGVPFNSYQTIIKDTVPAKEGNNSPFEQLVAENQQQRIAQASVLADSVSTRTDSEFPGGKSAWLRYLFKNFRYPKEAMDNNIQGLVLVKFIVDEKGRVKNVDALIGPKELRQEAARVIKQSGRWIPAKVNGKAVSSEKEQSITFKREFPEDNQEKNISDTITSSDTSVAHAVEIESSFPGGPQAWMRYLNRTVKCPDAVVRSGIQGTVVVQFIVDMEGNVSGVEAISGPTEGGLREEVIRVIKRSGTWLPATRNGVPVKSYKKQSVSFGLSR